MKNIILLFTFTFIGLVGISQNQPEKITKYITTFPNGEEAITIIESSNSSTLKLTSADNFYKYEILDLANHELIHKSTNKGKVCDIDKSKLEEGNYTLKVYTSDFIITSDISISNQNDEPKKVLN